MTSLDGINGLVDSDVPEGVITRLEVIGWNSGYLLGLALGSDHLHICGFLPINCPSERNNLRTVSPWESHTDTFTHKSAFTRLKVIYPRIKWDSFIFGLHSNKTQRFFILFWKEENRLNKSMAIFLCLCIKGYELK